MYQGKGKHKCKGKRYKGQSKGKTQWHNKGKVYTGYNNSGYGKGKAQTPIGYGNAFKGSGYTPVKGKTKGKGPPTWQGDKGKGKGACYRCGQMGHMAKDCRVRVYNVAEATEQQSTDQQQHYYEEQHNQQQYDPKYQQWSEQEAWQYEQQWFPEQQAQEYTQQQAPTLQQAQAVSSVKVEELVVASVTRTDLNTDATVAIMVDSGAAVHVCSPSFGAGFPLQKLTLEETPPLRSVTDEPLKILGYRQTDGSGFTTDKAKENKW